jgi:uncharacterized Zn finger protein (UPF0148 family)
MKALTCEMCGSTNLIKEGGVFVCQSCGTKYSVEEAKKMMVEGTVDVKGTVKVDTSDELKNLYEIARRAKDSDNSENATKYYDMILVKDPSSWEANFYVVYYKAMSCTIGQISSAGNSVMNCLPSVLDLVESNVSEDEKENVLKEIQARCSIIAHMLSGAALSTYLDTNAEYRRDYIGDLGDRVLAASGVDFTLGDILEEKFKGKYSALSVDAWKDSIEVFQLYTNQLPNYINLSAMQDSINNFGDKIKKYDESYVTPSLSKTSSSTSSTTNDSSSGCYVATAVYGSYDCPEVWTLRRFRDFTLDETWYGRLFIKAYYATSPTFVKYFGNVKLFKLQGKKLLDKWVAKLNSKGYENTPYEDKY